MSRKTWPLVAAATLMAACSSTQPPAEAPASVPREAIGRAEAAPSPVAKMSLLANAAAVAPGERIWLGARFEIAPGWHVYGRDPGDAGMPTRVTLDAPAGFVVGEAVYPEPRRFVDAGDIVTYGYERETLLMFPVDAPAQLEGDAPLTFRARGSWLACKQQCIKESGESALTLAASSGAREPGPSSAIFDRYMNLNPKETTSAP